MLPRDMKGNKQNIDSAEYKDIEFEYIDNISIAFCRPARKASCKIETD